MLSELSRDHVRKLESFGLRCDDDVARRECFCDFFSAMFGEFLIAVKVKKADMNAWERQNRKIGLVAVDVYGVKFVHNFSKSFDRHIIRLIGAFFNC